MKKIYYYGFGLLILGLLVFGIKTDKSLALDDLDQQIDNYSQELEQINGQIDEQQSKIDELDQKIEQYEENIKLKHNENLTLRNQIEVLQNDLDKNQAEIDRKNEQIELLELELKRLGSEITSTNQKIDKNKLTLGSYLAELYQYDQKTYLEITLGQNSFSEYSAQVEYIKELRDTFQQLLDEMQKLKGELTSKQKEQSEKKGELEQDQKALSIKQSSLDSEIDYKDNLLVDIKEDEGKFQQLVAEVRSEYQNTNATIAALDQEYRKKLKILKQKKAEQEQAKANLNVNGVADPNTQPIPAPLPDLPEAFDPAWPVIGEINAYFHDASYPFKKWFEHSGVDIDAEQGDPVYAADAGYIVIAKFDGSANYSYVMIAHAENYSTVYGHLSGIVVSPDQFVEKGELIGYAGGIPGTPGAGRFSTGSHLHFEVRLSGIPVDPLSYLP